MNSHLVAAFWFAFVETLWLLFVATIAMRAFARAWFEEKRRFINSIRPPYESEEHHDAVKTSEAIGETRLGR